MHTRGTPTTMRSLALYPNAGGVTAAVYAELGAAVSRARAAGIPPWRLVADPGIGFAKNEDHNLKLLRDLPEFVARLVYPMASTRYGGGNGGGGGGGGMLRVVAGSHHVHIVVCSHSPHPTSLCALANKMKFPQILWT